MALPIDNEVGLQDENNNLTIGDERPLVDPVGARAVDPIDVNSHVAIEANQRSDPETTFMVELDLQFEIPKILEKTGSACV